MTREQLPNELKAKSHRVKEKVHMAQEWLKYLFTSSPGVIYSCKPSGDYGATFISENISSQLGYEAREFIEDPSFWADRIHPEDKAHVFAGLQGLFEKGHHTHEYRFLHKDGSYRWMHDQLKLIRDSEGNPIEIVGFWMDITDRKKMEEALRESEERLHLLSSHLLRAQETERKRISMELHDELGQALIALKLRLSSIQKKLRKDQKILRSECEYVKRGIEQIVGNVRRLSQGLSPYLLETLGLTAALRRMIRDLSKDHKMETSLEIADIDNFISQEKQLIIYRIFQEALINVIRHAQATRISVAIKKENDTLSFSVEDDGKGFDAKQVMMRDFNEKGLGLAAMGERVRMLGGSLDIRSETGKGTKISFTIPVSPLEIPSGN